MSLFTNLRFIIHVILTIEIKMQKTVITDKDTITENDSFKTLIFNLEDVPAIITAVLIIHGVLSATCK